MQSPSAWKRRVMRGCSLRTRPLPGAVRRRQQPQISASSCPSGVNRQTSSSTVSAGSLSCRRCKSAVLPFCAGKKGIFLQVCTDPCEGTSCTADNLVCAECFHIPPADDFPGQNLCLSGKQKNLHDFLLLSISFSSSDRARPASRSWALFSTRNRRISSLT